MKQRYSKRKYYLPVGVSCGWWPQPPVCLGTSDPGEADPLLGDDQLGVLRGEGDRGPQRGERGGGRHQPWKYRLKIDTFFGCESSPISRNVRSLVSLSVRQMQSKG